MTSTSNKYPAWMNFPIGTLGGVAAWCLVHPMDVVKVRMQVHAERKLDTSIGGVVGAIVKERGPLALYDGLSAGIARQLVYATVRLGLYDVLRDAMVGTQRDPTIAERIVAGAAAGGVAAYLSCPVEVSLVRMQADAAAPKEQRRGYTNVVNALVRIVNEEGVTTFWRGATPTVVRAIAVGVTQVAGYDQIKAWLVKSGYFSAGSYSTFAVASMLTGVFYSFVTMPIETVKIRMQNQKPIAGGGLKYRNIAGALVTVARDEGVTSLWKGYLPYYGRCGCHTVGCFFVIDQLKYMLNKAYSS